LQKEASMLRRLVPVLCLTLCLPAPAQGPSKEALKLEKQLGDRDSRVRARAAWDLGKMGATGSVPALTRALDDPSGAVRANAAASLWKLAPDSKPAIPALQRALEDPVGVVVGNAAGALRSLGVPMSELVPAYRRLLERPDCESTVIGLKALATEVPPTDLFDAAWACADFPYADSDTQRDAREALRKIVGRRDRVLVPQILDTLKRLGSRDGSDLISAVSSLDPPVKEAVPVLVDLLASGDDPTRRSAIGGLGHMGVVALPAVPRLVDALGSASDAESRVAAAEALGRIGPKCATTAVPALAKAAEGDSWPKVRSTSLTALGEMGPAAKEAVPVLRAALKDPDGFISVAARNALFRVEPGKGAEVAAMADEARPVQEGILYDALSQLVAVLPGRVPTVYELTIYPGFAMATSACRDTSSGRCRYTYKGGAVTGPDEGSGSCEKTIALAKVDFSVVPGLVSQAPGLLGSPSGTVDVVQLSPGVFCKSHGWIVHVKGAGMVQFKINGKVDKVQKF
jgi:HEAT repeat protein